MIQTNPKNTRFKFFFPLFFSYFSFCDVNDDLVKAIKNNDYKNFEIALKNGADPNAKDAYSSVLLLTLSNSQEQMAIDLISKGANINDGYSVSTNAIFLAVNNKLSKASNLLINLGADITQLRQDGTNILMMAVNRDMQEVALNIISKKKLDINAVDKAGDTALSLALNKNYLEMAKILYKHGAKPRNMFEAIPIKDIESVKNFIEDTRQLMSIDKEGNTPLHTAYIYSNYEIAHLILKKKSINIDSENKNHLTASMIAAMNNDLKLISLAMGYGADILIPDRNGLTPLMYAVFYRNYELIWKILDYNKHAAFSIDNDGSSAFSYAVAYRDKKICQKLLKINGVMNQRKAKSPLSIAIANLDENMVELLLKNDVAINVKDCFDLIPLSMAIKMNSPKMVKFLLAKGADPQLTDRDGKTPLYYAQIYGNQDILDLLDTNTERHVDYYKK
ncbi:MAG: ankyrin repeat domain-containing protein [Endomicrobium sp.]|jgi:ankyrin repeat protein|uniref:ankyrin repeat domain-containing protein n=1 Tax=Candidatus Endomicrobiellum cubanum TaxID=3242325 RepID=UPI0028336F00|nr:ankyrin repeat domain-containing protein [Endomicrobium sp.]